MNEVLLKIDEALDTRATEYYQRGVGHGQPKLLLLMDHGTEREFYAGLISQHVPAFLDGVRNPYRGAEVIVTRDVEGFRVILDA